jgi:Lar family restriction alleviation protein
MKPCPFCGGKETYVDHVVIDDGYVYFRVCKKCECEGPVADSVEGAKKKWDERV